MNEASPVFIHSLFRASSTYVFNCFRRSAQGYWCYQEPLNEFLLNAAVAPEKFLQLHKDNVRHLRHPKIERPYFFEFYPLAEQIGRDFRADFSYEDYFSNSGSRNNDSLCQYLKLLVENAQGRPVFQECRSCGRVDAIRECIGGRHIFLWRNPWDQWWSFKVDSHFEICNLQILASHSASPLFIEIRKLLGFNPTSTEPASLVAYRLDAAGSYMLFFALWCHAILEARKRCHFDINIDSLSLCSKYRDVTIQRLEANSIPGIDFSDCQAPIGVYGKEDQEFFKKSEETVYELLSHYYQNSDIEELIRLRIEHEHHDAAKKNDRAGIATVFDRVRQIARRLESELSHSQRETGRLVYALQEKEDERQKVETAFKSKEVERKQAEETLKAKEEHCRKTEEALRAEVAEHRKTEEALRAEVAEHRKTEEALRAEVAERRKTEEALRAEVAERRKTEEVLRANEAELAKIKNSSYWRLGRPIRTLIGKIRKLLI